MKTNANGYRGHRFPREIISHSVWLYHRFSLSFRDVEELLAKRGIIVSYETIRQWCRKFGPEYARKLKRRQGAAGRCVAPGRGIRQDQGRAALPVASRGPRRGPDRRPGSTISQRPRGRTVLSQAAEGAGLHAVAAGDGQVEELRHRSSDDHASWITARHGTRTIELRCRISRHDNESVRCDASSQLAKHSGFCRSTGSS